MRRPDDQTGPLLVRRRASQAEDGRSTKRSIGRVRKDINKTFFRLRLIVLIAVTTGMRVAEIFGLQMVGRAVQRRAVGSAGQAEGRQDAVRPDDAGTGQRVAAVSRRDW